MPLNCRSNGDCPWTRSISMEGIGGSSISIGCIAIGVIGGKAGIGGIGGIGGISTSKSMSAIASSIARCISSARGITSKSMSISIPGSILMFIGGRRSMSSCISFSASSRSARSDRSTDGHSGGRGGTGARFARGVGVGRAADGFAAGEGAGAGVGAGVGFCASLESAKAPSATAMKVALIILPSF